MSVAYQPGGAAYFDEDLRLVDRFLTGESDAFRLLYERYYDKVFAIALGIVLDRDEAADVVQEIFTLVYRNLPRFDRKSRFGTWLFRIAVNRSIQQTRGLRHRTRHVAIDAADEISAPTSEDIEPEDPRIAAALERLKPEDRALLALYYWEQMSLADIAQTRGGSSNAAKTRLFRARERFRKIYEEME